MSSPPEKSQPMEESLSSTSDAAVNELVGREQASSVIVSEKMEVDASIGSSAEAPKTEHNDADEYGDGTLNEPEGDGDVEGEGEGPEGVEGAEDGDDAEDGDEDSEDEEEDDEEDDEDDSDGDGDESEDLEGSPEVIAIDGPDGPPPLTLLVKAEPASPGPAMDSVSQPLPEGSAPPPSAHPTQPAAVLGEGHSAEANVLVPKKKKRARLRSPSSDEDMAPPPPPMKTIRLSKEMVPQGETLEWNILEDARGRNLCVAWGVGVVEDLSVVSGTTNGDGEDKNGMEVDGVVAVQPPPGGIFSIMGDEDPEEVARRLEEKYGDKKKVKKKKRPTDYDLEDPFIDDSEILIDAPTHFARPKKEGYFVHAGPLELMESSPVKKRQNTAKPKQPAQNKSGSGPQSGKAVVEEKEPRMALSLALRDRRLHMGSVAILPSEDCQDSQLEAIVVDDDYRGSPSVEPLSSPHLGRSPNKPSLTSLIASSQPPVDRLLFKNAGREPKLLPPYECMPDEVARMLLSLRSTSLKHDWNHATKGKFPDHLKPPIENAGRMAYQHGLFGGFSEREGTDRSFFLCLPSIFPYNEFTLRKLTTKLCYLGYLKWLQDCEEEGIRQLGEVIDQEKGGWIEKWENSRREWESEVQTWDETHPNVAMALNTSLTTPLDTSVSAPAPAASSGPNAIHTPTPGPTDPNAPTPGSAVDKKDEKKDERPAEPPKRFFWSNDMREVLWMIIENMHEIAELCKKGVEWNVSGAKQGREWAEPQLKSKLYKRINDLFPEGYMSTNTISRELTKLKKKKEDAVARNKKEEEGGEA